MQKTVVQLCLSRAWGGLEMSCLKTARIFQSQGFRSVCIVSRGTRLEEEARKEGFETVVISPRGSHYISPFRTLEIRRAIKNLTPSAIFLHHLRDLWLTVPALKGFEKVRLFGFTRMMLKHGKHDFLHRWLYSRVEKLITLTDAQRDLLMPYLPVKQNKFITIPNGIDLKRFDSSKRSNQIRAEWGADNETCLLGLVGRLDFQKGQRELVEALSLIRKRNPASKWKAVFIGSETMSEEKIGFEVELRERVHALGLEKEIFFAGFRNDMPDVMASLDVLAMPSYEEAFGNVLLEAMASRVSVIATSSGGAPEIVGTTGPLVPPREFEELSLKLEELFSSRSLREQNAELGLKRVHQLFDRDKVALRLSSLVEK